jgi:hypothetical protein
MFKDIFINRYVFYGKKLLQKILNEKGGIKEGVKIDRIFDDRLITDAIRNGISVGQWGRTTSG